MDAAAEAEVRRPPGRGDVEVRAARLGSRRLAEQVDRGPGRDVEPVEGEVRQGFPGDPGRGGADPHDLFDRRRPQSGVLAEDPPLAGMVHEDLQGQAELVPGGVEAAEDQQDERVAQLGTGEPALGPLRLHQAGHDVIARVAPPRGDQRVGIVAERRERRLDPGQVLADPNAHGQPQRRRLGRDRGPLLLGEAEHDRDDPGCVGLGELGHELAPPRLGERVDQLPGQVAEARPQRLDGPAGNAGLSRRRIR